jgi:TadE-like protein
MVEFAIVLPVLILIILGILYFGRYETEMRLEVAATAAPPPNTDTGWATNAPPANTCPTT